MSKIHSHHRQIWASPGGGASRKRKERDAFDAPRATTTSKAEPLAPSATAMATAPPQPANGTGANRLLAGYLAHEFLTKGTLFGQRWDPAAAAAKPLGARYQEVPKKPPSQQVQPPPPQQSTQQMKPTAYADVASFLKTDGAHIPGVVNPTQLARWLQQM